MDGILLEELPEGVDRLIQDLSHDHLHGLAALVGFHEDEQLFSFRIIH